MGITNIINIDTILGKITIIILIMIASHYHILFGITIVLIFISISDASMEGMENMEDKKDTKNKDSSKEPSQKTFQDKFRKTNCQDNTLMKNNKEVTPDLIKKSFPNIKFGDNVCNPCDLDCNFEIIDSNERLSTETSLRAEDSNNIPIDREKKIKKQ